MVLNDSLANALSKISQYEDTGKKEVIVKPFSKVITTVLDLLNKHGYVGTYEEVEDGKGNYLKLNLIGMVNTCGVIKPRFSVKSMDIEKSEKKYLPAKGFGVLILSTPQGIMTHEEAKEKKIGGVLLAYCY